MPQGPPPTTPPVAFADESFREDPAEGCSVLAAAVLEHQVQEPAREVMRRLLGSRRTNKLHWHEMDRLQQKDAAHRVAGISAIYVVALGTPVPRRRQERARAACLTALVSALHSFGVHHLLLEARTAELNRRDIATVQGARFALPRAATSGSITSPDLSSRCCGWPTSWPAPSEPATQTGRCSWSCWVSTCTCWRYPPAVSAADMRKARLPVCPRSPGLAARPTPTVPD